MCVFVSVRVLCDFLPPPGPVASVQRLEKDFAEFVLKTQLLKSGVEGKDPWLTAISLWLLRYPVLSVGVAISGRPEGAAHMLPPAPVSRAPVSASAKPAAPTTNVGVASTSGFGSQDPELVRFARFMLDKPQLKERRVIKGIAAKVCVCVSERENENCVLV